MLFVTPSNEQACSDTHTDDDHHMYFRLYPKWCAPGLSYNSFAIKVNGTIVDDLTGDGWHFATPVPLRKIGCVQSEKWISSVAAGASSHLCWSRNFSVVVTQANSIVQTVRMSL